MSDFSLTWMTNFSHMSWKYWIMMDYRKTNKILDGIQRFGSIKLIDWCQLVDTIDSLISTKSMI